MKTPPGLQPLIDDGVIDEVLRSLKSGKEATVYLVRSGSQVRCAKVYRDMAQRSFQKRAHVSGGPQSRAAAAKHAPWARARASAAGSRKPRGRTRKSTRSTSSWPPACACPSRYGYFNDTLIMELVTDAGRQPGPAPG